MDMAGSSVHFDVCMKVFCQDEKNRNQKKYSTDEDDATEIIDIKLGELHDGRRAMGNINPSFNDVFDLIIFSHLQNLTRYFFSKKEVFSIWKTDLHLSFIFHKNLKTFAILAMRSYRSACYGFYDKSIQFSENQMKKLRKYGPGI